MIYVPSNPTCRSGDRKTNRREGSMLFFHIIEVVHCHVPNYESPSVRTNGSRTIKFNPDLPSYRKKEKTETNRDKKKRIHKIARFCCPRTRARNVISFHQLGLCGDERRVHFPTNHSLVEFLFHISKR
mmetsp:Transcript_958/g.2450  ORF Transcript_958/g.2450 Transcript_958/m.2450 type:complete len:128 (+) Transcript_958:229-612(+)